MDVNVINSFLLAAYDVFGKELSVSAQKGSVALFQGQVAIDDFTIKIMVSGDSEGTIWYSMDNKTACTIASRMMESQVDELDDMAESALGELASMISGAVAMHLEKVSISCTLSIPTVMKGKRSCILGDVPALSIPVVTPLGSLYINVSIARQVTAGSQP